MDLAVINYEHENRQWLTTCLQAALLTDPDDAENL